MKKNLLPFIVCILLTTQLSAQEDLKTQSISIFKNGKSFVLKQGKVKTTNKVYTINKIPNALFGTLWFSGKDSKIVEVSSKLEVVSEAIERKASTFTDLLFANKGKEVSIITSDDKIYTGIVEDYDLPEEINTIMQLKETEIKAKYNSDFRLFPIESPVLILKMNNKWVSIAPSLIKTIEFMDRPERTAKFNINIEKPLINVKFDGSGDQTLNMMFLQNGISWTPTYLLELKSPTEATLKLQAEVLNDAEDIANTDINFVIGVPNFKYANQSAILTTFNNVIAPRMENFGADFSQRFSNAMMASYSDVSFDESNETFSNVDPEASGELYFYNIKNVSLDKGARAYYPIFTSPIKVRHFYECNLSAPQDERSYQNYNGMEDFSFNPKLSNVFHTLEITNNTNQPFTTGSVMIVEGEKKRPLAEDLITYTGVGQKSFIKLTQAPDISVKEQEKVISTKDNVKSRNGYSYRLLTIQNDITIVNSKNTDVDMILNKTIIGKSKTSNVQYSSIQVPNSDSNSLNLLDKLSFNINLKAGQKQVITYIYEIYVRE